MAKIFIVGYQNNDNKKIYDGLLNTGGHDVLYTSDSRDLLKPLFLFKPDIIILDVPPGDSANFGKICELKKHPNFSNVPILMVLNNSESEINLAMSHGANEYIIKPIREVELTSRIGLLLNRNNLFSSEFKPGAVFAERYKILALLGKGGDSTVYHALDTGSVPEREVALKILKIKEDPEIFASLIDRETHGLAQLDHPNIVKLLDHGNFKGTFYLATEFIKGRSLGEIIKESPLVEESAVDLALEVAEALQYISRFGIVHRDIKPDNILISDIGEVVIVDFGLAREAHQQTVAIRGEMFGTPQYLAPEYINGKDVDIKTDIYSLGITLFYMVSGILPFRAGTPMAFLHKQLNEAPPLLNEIAGGISKEFAELIDSMLIKNPTDRISLDQMIASFKKLQARHKAATPA